MIPFGAQPRGSSLFTGFPEKHRRISISEGFARFGRVCIMAQDEVKGKTQPREKHDSDSEPEDLTVDRTYLSKRFGKF